MRIFWPAKPSCVGLLGVLSVAVVACMAFMLAAGAQWTRSRQVAEAGKAMDAAAQRTASELGRRMDRADIALRSMTALVSSSGRRDPSVQRIARQALQALVSGLPDVVDLWLVDPSGRVWVAARSSTTLDMSGRADFAALRESDRGLVLGPRLPMGAAGTASMTLSRRISDAGGNFLGVAVAGLIVEDALQQPGVPYAASLTAYVEDGSSGVAVDGLAAAALLPHTLRSRLWGGTGNDSHGVLRDDAGEAHPRIWAWQRLDTAPLTVVAAAPMGKVLVAWRREMLPGFLFGMAALAGLSLFALIAVRRLSSERLAQTRLRKAAEAIGTMLQEKDALLAEVHHRVKNNMQVVVNLLQMEAAGLRDSHARHRLDAMGSRITLIGRIHERIYASDNFARMDLSGHLAEHCEELAAGRPDASVELCAERLSCGLDMALPLALIAHELVSNALFHGTGEKGRVDVCLARAQQSVTLSVRDGGAGPSGEQAPGLGLTLVQVLAEQIGAIIDQRQGEGYCVRVLVPDDAFANL